MNKSKKAISVLIEDEKRKLEGFEARRVELDRKIRAAKARIEKYELIRKDTQFNLLSNALDGAGVSFDEIIAALSAGDLLGLQDKILLAQKLAAENENSSLTGGESGTPEKSEAGTTERTSQ